MKRVIIAALMLAFAARAQDAAPWWGALAADSAVGIVYEPESNFTYIVSEDKAAITGYTGRGGQLNIPPTLGGYTVTDVGNYVFDGNPTITGLRLPDNLQRVGYAAFRNCSNIVSNLILPNTFTTGGSYSFSGCYGFTGPLVLPRYFALADFEGCSGLTSLSFHSDSEITSISGFGGCSGMLGTLTLPKYTERIEWGALLGTGFHTIILPETVIFLDHYAFSGCPNLLKLYFSGNAPTAQATAFSGTSNATIYRRADATGWPTAPGTFGGIPTAVWTSYPDLMP